PAPRGAAPRGPRPPPTARRTRCSGRPPAAACRWPALPVGRCAPRRSSAVPHAHGAVDRVVVEARDHLAAEERDRLEGDLLGLRRGEHAEDELIAADVGVPLDGARALVGIADHALALADALLELIARRLGDQLRPGGHAGRPREGVEVPEDEARVVTATPGDGDVARRAAVPQAEPRRAAGGR